MQTYPSSEDRNPYALIDQTVTHLKDKYGIQGARRLGDYIAVPMGPSGEYATIKVGINSYVGRGPGDTQERFHFLDAYGKAFTGQIDVLKDGRARQWNAASNEADSAYQLAYHIASSVNSSGTNNSFASQMMQSVAPLPSIAPFRTGSQSIQTSVAYSRPAINAGGLSASEFDTRVSNFNLNSPQILGLHVGVGEEDFNSRYRMTLPVNKLLSQGQLPESWQYDNGTLTMDTLKADRYSGESGQVKFMKDFRRQFLRERLSMPSLPTVEDQSGRYSIVTGRFALPDEPYGMGGTVASSSFLGQYAYTDASQVHAEFSPEQPLSSFELGARREFGANESISFGSSGNRSFGVDKPGYYGANIVSDPQLVVGYGDEAVKQIMGLFPNENKGSIETAFKNPLGLGGPSQAQLHAGYMQQIQDRFGSVISEPVHGIQMRANASYRMLPSGLKDVTKLGLNYVPGVSEDLTAQGIDTVIPFGDIKSPDLANRIARGLVNVHQTSLMMARQEEGMRQAFDNGISSARLPQGWFLQKQGDLAAMAQSMGIDISQAGNRRELISAIAQGYQSTDRHLDQWRQTVQQPFMNMYNALPDRTRQAAAAAYAAYKSSGTWDSAYSAAMPYINQQGDVFPIAMPEGEVSTLEYKGERGMTLPELQSLPQNLQQDIILNSAMNDPKSSILQTLLNAGGVAVPQLSNVNANGDTPLANIEKQLTDANISPYAALKVGDLTVPSIRTMQDMQGGVVGNWINAVQGDPTAAMAVRSRIQGEYNGSEQFRKDLTKVRTQAGSFERYGMFGINSPYGDSDLVVGNQQASLYAQQMGVSMDEFTRAANAGEIIASSKRYPINSSQSSLFRVRHDANLKGNILVSALSSLAEFGDRDLDPRSVNILGRGNNGKFQPLEGAAEAFAAQPEMLNRAMARAASVIGDSGIQSYVDDYTAKFGSAPSPYAMLTGRAYEEDGQKKYWKGMSVNIPNVGEQNLLGEQSFENWDAWQEGRSPANLLAAKHSSTLTNAQISNAQQLTSQVKGRMSIYNLAEGMRAAMAPNAGAMNAAGLASTSASLHAGYSTSDVAMESVANVYQAALDAGTRMRSGEKVVGFDPSTEQALKDYNMGTGTTSWTSADLPTAARNAAMNFASGAVSSGLLSPEAVGGLYGTTPAQVAAIAQYTRDYRGKTTSLSPSIALQAIYGGGDYTQTANLKPMPANAPMRQMFEAKMAANYSARLNKGTLPKGLTADARERLNQQAMDVRLNNPYYAGAQLQTRRNSDVADWMQAYASGGVTKDQFTAKMGGLGMSQEEIASALAHPAEAASAMDYSESDFYAGTGAIGEPPDMGPAVGSPTPAADGASPPRTPPPPTSAPPAADDPNRLIPGPWRMSQVAGSSQWTSYHEDDPSNTKQLHASGAEARARANAGNAAVNTGSSAPAPSVNHAQASNSGEVSGGQRSMNGWSGNALNDAWDTWDESNGVQRGPGILKYDEFHNASVFGPPYQPGGESLNTALHMMFNLSGGVARPNGRTINDIVKERPDLVSEGGMGRLDYNFLSDLSETWVERGGATASELRDLKHRAGTQRYIAGRTAPDLVGPIGKIQAALDGGEIPEIDSRTGKPSSRFSPSKQYEDLGDALKRATDALKDFRQGVDDGTKVTRDSLGKTLKNIGDAQDSLKVAKSLFEATGGESVDSPEGRARMGSADAASRGLSAAWDSAIGGSGLPPGDIAKAREYATSGGSEPGGSRLARTLMGGVFGFMVARDIRYTIQPIEKAGQEYLATQQAAYSAIAQSQNVPGFASQSQLQNNIVALQNAQYGFGQNAQAYMTGVTGLAANITGGNGAGLGGALATIGLPAVGAMLVGAAIGGPAGAAVGGVAGLGMLTAGTAAYLSGAASDQQGAIRGNLFRQQNGYLPTTTDTEGAVAAFFNDRRVENAQNPGSVLNNISRGSGLMQGAVGLANLFSPIAALGLQGVLGYANQTQPTGNEQQIAQATNELKGFNGSIVGLSPAAQLQAVQTIVPGQLSKQYGISMQQAQGISAQVFSLQPGGNPAAMAALSHLAAANVDTSTYGNVAAQLADATGQLSVSAPNDIIAQGLPPDLLGQQLKDVMNAGGQNFAASMGRLGLPGTQGIATMSNILRQLYGNNATTALSGYGAIAAARGDLSRDAGTRGFMNNLSAPLSLGMLTNADTNFSLMGGAGTVMGLNQMGLQGASSLITSDAFLGQAPTQQTAMLGQLMQSASQGDPRALTMLGTQQQFRGTANAMPLMDITTGQGLFQRSMWGLTSYSMPTSQQVGSYFSNNSYTGAYGMIGGANQNQMIQAAMGTNGNPGGIAGLEILGSQWQFQNQMASLGVQAAQLTAEHNYQISWAQPSQWAQLSMRRAQQFGGTVDAQTQSFFKANGIPIPNYGEGTFAWQQQDLNLQEAGAAAQASHTQTEFGWQLQDINRQQMRYNVQAGWQRQDFALQRQGQLNDRSMQQATFQYQGTELQLQHQYFQQDWAYNQQVRQQNYGFNLNEENIAISRSSGFQRQELLRQRSHDTQMYNAESGQQTKIKDREEQGFNRQEDYFKKQIAHWQESIKLEDTNFANAKKRFEQQVQWQNQDFEIQKGRIKERMGWAAEEYSRTQETFKIKQKQLDAEKSAAESQQKFDEVSWAKQRELEQTKYQLSLASLGIAMREAQQQQALADAIAKMRSDEVSRVKQVAQAEIDGWNELLYGLYKNGILKSFSPIGGGTGGGNPANNNDGSGSRQFSKASGGEVRAGQSYWVGEVGPETFTPATDGHITPSGLLPSGSSYALPGNSAASSWQMQPVNLYMDGKKVGAGLMKYLPAMIQKDTRRR